MARAIAAAGGIPVLVDINPQRAGEKAAALADEYGVPAMGCAADITRQAEIEALRDLIVGRFGRLDILINNAANNPKMEASAEVNFSRLENFPLAQWEADIAVGLTGAFLCSKVLGSYMAGNGGGVIVNVASDLALIAPDQRIYRQPGVAEDMQPVKPVTYSVVKSALVGLDAIPGELLGRPQGSRECDFARRSLQRPAGGFCAAADQPDSAGTDGGGQ